MEICRHCGQELQKASQERKEISDALEKRHIKLDLATDELLGIIKRIEQKVGADEETANDVKELELRIREKIQKQLEEEESE